ncbi:hypothetical protein ACROYT_G036367 [Oculina patagonica]
MCLRNQETHFTQGTECHIRPRSNRLCSTWNLLEQYGPCVKMPSVEWMLSGLLIETNLASKHKNRGTTMFSNTDLTENFEINDGIKKSEGKSRLFGGGRKQRRGTSTH